MSTERPSSWKWWVCVALGLATFLNYMDRQALAVSLPTLKKVYALGEARVGLLEGCFGYAFALGCVIFGVLADRFGPRLLYPIVLFGWSLAGIATSFASIPEVANLLEFPGDSPGTGVFRWLVSCRIALGLFEAGHWPCALLTARQILSEKDRTLGNGILQSGASLGAILIPIYIQIVDWCGLGWSFAFWSVGALGLFWIPLWLMLVRRSDFVSKHDSADQVEDATQVHSELWRRILVLALIVSTINISWQFLRAWLPLFLQDFHKYSPELTRGCTSAYFIATDIGCIAAGLLVKWLVSRGYETAHSRKLGFTLFTLFTATAALVPFTDGGPLTVLCLMLAGAGILGLHPYYYAFVQDLPSQRMATYSGTLAAFGWIIASTFQIFIGAEIERQKSYDLGLTLVGLLPFLGLAALWTVRLHKPS
jgi:MFS transporter, ACS family, hexuronate transporter